MAAHLPAERKLELYKALADGEQTATKIAKRLNLNRATVYKARKDLFRAGLKALTDSARPAPEPESPTPLQVHDAGFWRQETRKLRREHGRLERVIEELSGMRRVPVQIPDWIVPTRRGRRGRAVVGMLVSDIHDGEVIDAEEILNVNAFDPDICEKRLMRYFEAACVVGSRWAEDCDTEGALLALAGDLVSGDIHEELTRTNALTAHEQVRHVVGVLHAGIDRVLEQYGRVHVIGVPGNHGRTTRKPTAKLYARLSYDTLVVDILADRFRNDDRVTFQNNKAKDQITPVLGRTVFTTHGDKIGTRGGMGFVGPMLPIIRGSKKISEQQSGVGRRPDLIQFGHYHVTGNPGGDIFANGSIPGYSEYADDIRAAAEPPQQWLYLLHDKWWVREREPIKLEEPKPPEKPRIRIHVEMARA